MTGVVLPPGVHPVPTDTPPLAEVELQSHVRNEGHVVEQVRLYRHEERFLFRFFLVRVVLRNRIVLLIIKCDCRIDLLLGGVRRVIGVHYVVGCRFQFGLCRLGVHHPLDSFHLAYYQRSAA